MTDKDQQRVIETVKAILSRPRRDALAIPAALAAAP